MDNTKSALHDLVKEKLPAEAAESVMKIWFQCSDREIEDIYSLCKSDPDIIVLVANLYTAQIAAVKSGDPNDKQFVLSRSFELAERLKGGVI